jgi:hypothetical protein
LVPRWRRATDEGLQARELLDMHQVEAAGVAGVFVFTFVAPRLTYDDDPRLDLDVASYGLVRRPAISTGAGYKSTFRRSVRSSMS